MSRLLPYLPALACPLLMLVCMAGMRRMAGTPARTQEPPPASAADRIARLERELAALRAEQPAGQPPGPADPAPVPAEPPPGLAERAPARPHGDPPAAPAGRVS
jgi:hypothetical protein